MCTRLWLLENQIGTKVTDTIDPLDVQYDRNGRPYTYTAAEGYKPTTARVGSKSITRFNVVYLVLYTKKLENVLKDINNELDLQVH